MARQLDPSGPVKQRSVSLSVAEDDLARWLAERSDGGNISRLFRRLIRVEAARYEDAPLHSRSRENVTEPIAA